MRAEYQVPESVPDVPSMPDDLPEIPADPTGPGGDMEPQARFGTMRLSSQERYRRA